MQLKYRGKGIDIRSEGGLIVCPGSIIDNKEYKIVFNTLAMTGIPLNLVEWIL
jgi:hypothetical protein